MGAPHRHRLRAKHALRGCAIFGIAPLAFLAVSIVLSSRAHAGALYYEISAGVSRWENSGSLYNGGNPSGTGYAVNADAFTTIGGSGGPVEFQGGFLSRYTLGSDASSTYTLATIYPELRVQVNFLFLGAGITPLVWRKGGPEGSLAFEGFASRLAYNAEAGVLWSVVPIFSLGFAASGEFVNSAAGSGPAPVLTGTVLMRFYFSFFGRTDGGGSRSSESRGWRYPFGDYNGK